MNKYIAIILLTFSGSAFAEAYLCIAEEGAGVSINRTNNTFASNIYDVSGEKYVHSNSSGEWTVTKFGDEEIWMPCTTQFYCAPPKAVGTYFFRDSENFFTASWMTIATSPHLVSTDITVAGRCSQI